jgi:hypothetical protein
MLCKLIIIRAKDKRVENGHVFGGPIKFEYLKKMTSSLLTVNLTENLKFVYLERYLIFFPLKG